MRARIIILFLVAVILLSVTGLIQNLPMIYADNLDNQSSQVSSVTKSSTSSPPNAAQQQEQLQQQIQQTQQPLQQQQTLIAPYNTMFNNNNNNNNIDNNIDNNTDNVGISNSNPRSSIKVTSIDQQVPEPITSSSQNDRSQPTNYSGNDHQYIPNLVVNGGSPVTLDGSLSYDPDGNQIIFAWTQIAGPSVIISDANTPKAKFIAPNVVTDKIMSFELTVTDENGLSYSGIVQITVIPSTSPPVGK
jgi:hypothetical protein